MSRLGDFLSNLWNRIKNRTQPNPQPNPIPQPNPVPNPGTGMIAAINQQRINAGLQPLIPNDILNEIAIACANEMARLNRLSHQRENGQSPQEIARLLGYHGLLGECIALGPHDIESVVALWMSDPPHRQIILDRSYRSIGWAMAIGLVGPYWCLDVGTV